VRRTIELESSILEALMRLRFLAMFPLPFALASTVVACSASPSASGSAAAERTGTTKSAITPPPWLRLSTHESASDRYGMDVMHFAAASVQDCYSACLSDWNSSWCNAWTYRSDGSCWLKEGSPNPVYDSNAESGRIKTALEWGINRYGNDYYNYRELSQWWCRDRCELDPYCRAFTFTVDSSPVGDGNGGVCWLKNAVGSPSSWGNAYSGFKGIDVEAVRFDSGDYRLWDGTGDWKPGSYKGECSYGGAVSGLSNDPTVWTAHAALCSDDDPYLYPHKTCTTVDFTYGDNRRDTSTGDWDSGFVKGECGWGEYVAGVSQRPDGLLDSILCCQGRVAKTSCAPLYNYAGDWREDTSTGDWDNSYYKLECAPGRWVAGVARNTRPGQPGGPDAVLCCN
jgi:hypothetical protein